MPNSSIGLVIGAVGASLYKSSFSPLSFLAHALFKILPQQKTSCTSSQMSLDSEAAHSAPSLESSDLSPMIWHRLPFGHIAFTSRLLPTISASREKENSPDNSLSFYFSTLKNFSDSNTPPQKTLHAEVRSGKLTLPIRKTNETFIFAISGVHENYCEETSCQKSKNFGGLRESWKFWKTEAS